MGSSHLGFWTERVGIKVEWIIDALKWLILLEMELSKDTEGILASSLENQPLINVFLLLPVPLKFVIDLTMASDGSIANTTLKGLSAHYEPALGCKSCIWVWLCIHLFVINNNLTAFSGYYWKIGHFSTEVRQHRVLLQPLKTHCITSLIVSSVLFTLCSNPFTSAKAIKAHHAGTLANKCDLFEPPLTISTNWVSITYSYRHSFNMQM